MIKFVSNLRQVSGYLRSSGYLRLSPVCSTYQTNRHDSNEILLKVALNTIKPVMEKELVGFVLNMHDMFVDRC